MHEVSVIDEIVQTVLDEIKNYQVLRVDSVSLRIGKLRQFVPEIMQFCYEVATRDTLLQGSQLKLKEVPVQIFCRRCEMTTELEEYDFHCPECQSMDIQVTGGNELILDSIQLEEKATATTPINKLSKEIDYGT